ncbi:MAG: hypothetical protein AAF802_27290, partial [Planctomycetota bacterium]
QPRPTQPNETATDDGAAITSKQELAAKEPAVAKKSEDGQWAERMLKELSDPPSLKSDAEEVFPQKASEPNPSTVERQQPPVEVRSSSASTKQNANKVFRPDQETREPVGDTQAAASGKAGDLLPELPAPEPPLLDYTGMPTRGVAPNRTAINMRRGMERTLSYFYNRPEAANGRSNWGMMHAMMVYGADTQITAGRQRHSAVAWIAGNNNCRGQRLLTHDASGIRAKTGVGLQGHQAQFLAVLGMCEIPSDYPLYAGQVKYSIDDLIRSEQLACEAGAELTFTLIGLSHYLDTDSSWLASDGSRWDFERLIEEELKQPIVGAACGGTHRLMGYAHALRKRRAEGKPITGQWKRAEVYTNDFINYAYSLQNRDGSMSTDWFEGRAEKRDIDRKIQTTGHIVEWLLTVTPDDQLQNRRLQAAISFLTRTLGSELDRDWSIGPKGHALRSLSMYHQRVFRAGTPWVPAAVARAIGTRRR